MYAQTFAAPVSDCLQATAAASLLLLTACADLHWQKPGADTVALDRDLDQCALQARLDARRAETPRLDSALMFRADPQGRPVVVPSTTRDTDRYLAERDFTGACMRGRGYVLAPGKHS